VKREYIGWIIFLIYREYICRTKKFTQIYMIT
jgi:hypothetical protein